MLLKTYFITTPAVAKEEALRFFSKYDERACQVSTLVNRYSIEVKSDHEKAFLAALQDSGLGSRIVRGADILVGGRKKFWRKN